MHPRESFKQTASNLAKLLKKVWPQLSGLIFEKQRKRTNSGMSSVDGSQSQSKDSSFGEIGAVNNTALKLNRMARAMSQQDDPFAQELAEPKMRNRADSYLVENPIDESLKE